MDVIEAEFLTTAMNVAQLPPPVFAEVAFAGRSNVGKSSLINSLAQRKKLARTSSTPGCTRALNCSDSRCAATSHRLGRPARLRLGATQQERALELGSDDRDLPRERFRRSRSWAPAQALALAALGEAVAG